MAIPTISDSPGTNAADNPFKLDRAIENELLNQLRKYKILVAVVESCTGGELAGRITDTPGASDHFWGGWITYQTPAKSSLLGISPQFIDEHFVVSAEVAGEMARAGAQQLNRLAGDRLNSFSGIIVVSTTGVTGPGPLRPDKQAGLCYLGISHQIRALDLTGRRAGDWGPLVTSTRKIFSPSPRTRTQNKSYFCDEAIIFMGDKLRLFEPEAD